MNEKAKEYEIFPPWSPWLVLSPTSSIGCLLLSRGWRMIIPRHGDKNSRRDDPVSFHNQQVTIFTVCVYEPTNPSGY